MSTITSPRPSLGVRIPSSARSSLSIDRGTPTNSRRNRAALRDYYNIKNAEGTDSTVQKIEYQIEALGEPSELDTPDFDAANYVHTTLSRSSLADVLQTEAELVGGIRGLDGERKALVYDNYSRLIAATDTIARMRTDMDPMASEVAGRLGSAIGEIVISAVTLARTTEELTVLAKEDVDERFVEELAGRDEQRNTVRWVLSASARLAKMIQDGKKQEANLEWKEVERLLNRWEGVKGAEEVKQQCSASMRSAAT